MAIIVAILMALGGALFWWARSNPRDALGVADDALTIARNAPRKLAFRRQTKGHPAEGIDDPVLAIVTLGNAFLELDDLPTREGRQKLHVLTRRIWRMSEEEAQECLSLARWLLEQCGGADATLDRVARRLYRLDQGESWADLEALLAGLGEDGLSTRQTEAFADLKRILTRPDKG